MRKEYQMSSLGDSKSPSKHQSNYARYPALSPKSSGNLNKYCPLPPIKQSPEKKAVSTISMDDETKTQLKFTRLSRAAHATDPSERESPHKKTAELDEIKIPVAPETDKLFVTVLARTRTMDEHRRLFGDGEHFFFQQLPTVDEESTVIASLCDLDADCMASIRGVLEDTIDEIVRDLQNDNFVNTVVHGDIPVFYHLSQRLSDLLVFDFDDTDHCSTDQLARCDFR